MAQNKCLVLIKPLGMEAYILPEILAGLGKAGTILESKVTLTTETDIISLYSLSGHGIDGNELPHFRPMIQYLSNKHLMVMVMQGHDNSMNICDALDDVIGPWECHKARLDQIRHIPVRDRLPYLIDIHVKDRVFTCTDNLLHSSDSLESAEREIPIWFGNV